MKNEIDGNRLKVHSQYTFQGRLFIKFISLILYSEISNTMKEKKLFKSYSVKEILAEMKKIRITKIGSTESFLTELSNKQKIILSAFDIGDNIKHGY